MVDQVGLIYAENNLRSVILLEFWIIQIFSTTTECPFDVGVQNDDILLSIHRSIDHVTLNNR